MVQNISDTTPIIIAMEAKNKGVREIPLSKIYTKLRGLKNYDLVGDYPMLAHILEVCGIKRWTRNQILNACKKMELEPDRKQAYIPKQWEKFIY